MEKKSAIFFGTSNFSSIVLKDLINYSFINIIAVVSQPDRAIGRRRKIAPTKTKYMAVNNNIPVYQTNKLSGSKIENKLISMRADFLITASFGQFISNKLLNSAKIASINVHPSLLPKYRGAAPINWALIHNEKETGVTIMYMIKKMDAGDILAEKRVPILKKDTAGSLFKKLAIIGGDLLLKTIPKIVSNSIRPIPQNQSMVTFAPKINFKDTKINFYKQNSYQVMGLIKGLSPKPGAFFLFKGKKIKVFFAELGPLKGKAGQISVKNKKQLAITASDGKTIYLKKIQLEGKKIMDIKDFLNGIGQTVKIGDWTN